MSRRRRSLSLDGGRSLSDDDVSLESVESLGGGLADKKRQRLPDVTPKELGAALLFLHTRLCTAKGRLAPAAEFVLSAELCKGIGSHVAKECSKPERDDDALRRRLHVLAAGLLWNGALLHQLLADHGTLGCKAESVPSVSSFSSAAAAQSAVVVEAARGGDRGAC